MAPLMVLAVLAVFALRPIYTNHIICRICITNESLLYGNWQAHYRQSQQMILLSIGDASFISIIDCCLCSVLHMMTPIIGQNEHKRPIASTQREKV